MSGLNLLTGSELGNIGTGRPGEMGYMPSDPANYNEAVSGLDAERRNESVRDETQSLIDHDVLDWVIHLTVFTQSRLSSYTS